MYADGVRSPSHRDNLLHDQRIAISCEDQDDALEGGAIGGDDRELDQDHLAKYCQLRGDMVETQSKDGRFQGVKTQGPGNSREGVQTRSRQPREYQAGGGSLTEYDRNTHIARSTMISGDEWRERHTAVDPPRPM